MSSFNAGDSLGSLSPDEIAAYLQDIGDEEEARKFLAGAGGQAWNPFHPPYSHTGMVLGFIPPDQGATQVQGISTVSGDQGLIGKKIKVTLDKFYVANYPGHGKHTVLFEFTGKNQATGKAEELTFALRFEASDGTGASITGAPVFLGLTVAKDGISFKGRTVNVKSSLDDFLLATLNTPAFRAGLTLLSTAQPALKPLSSLATAAVGAVLTRKQNKQIHSFDLGLDSAGSATSARLRLGSYVVVQTDDAATWDWTHYEWNPDGLALHPAGRPSEKIDFNYVVFAVSPFFDSK